MNETLCKVIELRDVLKRATTEYLHENDWLEVTCSTLTPLTGSCETISSVFGLPYFSRKAHLSQTAQLQLEMLVKELRRPLWTFHHSFRAEDRITKRHLTEFTMIELEAPHFSLDNIMSIQEKMIQCCIAAVQVEKVRGLVSEERIMYLKSIQYPFPRCQYAEAIKILKTMDFNNVEVGTDLKSEHETSLIKYFNNKPFFIVNFPSNLKYFNMKRHTDPNWVYSVDLIAPPFGEISGGAEREYEIEKVEANLFGSQMWKDIQEKGLEQDDFKWYLGLWEKDTPGPRGGFGMGFERLVGFISGIDDICQCTEFPRNRELLFP